jgi:hypothetical protein
MNPRISSIPDLRITASEGHHPGPAWSVLPGHAAPRRNGADVDHLAPSVTKARRHNLGLILLPRIAP